MGQICQQRQPYTFHTLSCNIPSKNRIHNSKGMNTPSVKRQAANASLW